MSDLQTCPLGTANSAARAELTACADLAGDAGLAVPEGEVQSEDHEQVPSLW